MDASPIPRIVFKGALLVAPSLALAWTGIAGAAPPGEESAEGRASVRERLAAARSLLDGGSYAQALDEYLWLWRNMARLDPAMRSVRVSFTASDMRRLVDLHDPARAAFSTLREEAEGRLNQGRTPDDLTDWMVLNEILGDQGRTLAWFDAVKGDSSAAADLQSVAFRLEPLLAEAGRWADLGRLYLDPLALMRREQETRALDKGRPAPASMSEEQRARLEAARAQTFRTRTGRLYGALLAADRPNDAEKFAAEAQRIDESPRMLVALVSGALEAGRALPSHLDWAKEAGRTGEATDGLLQRLQSALGAKAVP